MGPTPGALMAEVSPSIHVVGQAGPMTRSALLSLTAALSLALSLSACGGGEDKQADVKPAATSANPFGGSASSTPTGAESATTQDSTPSTSSEPTPSDEPTEPALLSRDAAVETMAESIRSSGGGAFNITDQEATCVAEDVVDSFGIGRLAELGFSGADANQLNLSDEEALTMADAMIECNAMSATKMKQMMKDQMGGDVPGADGCLDDLITDKLMRDLFIAGINGEDTSTLTTTLGTDLASCLADA